MPVIVDCQTCGRKLRIPDDLMGQQVKCPTCGHTFRSVGPPPISDTQEPFAGEGPAAPPAPPRAPEPMRRMSVDEPVTHQPPGASTGGPDSSAEAPEPARPRPPNPPAPKVPSLDPQEQRSRPGGGFGFVMVGEDKADPAPPGRRPPAPLPDQGERDSRGSRSRDLRVCRYCGEGISWITSRCPHCGGWVGKAGDSGHFDERQSQRRDVEPHRGGLILTLGILGLVVFPIGWTFGLAAWIMGQRDLAKINSGIMDNAGYGTTQAGWICGIIATILAGIPTLCGGGCILWQLISNS